MVARSSRDGQGFLELRVELAPESREGSFRVSALGELGEFSGTFVNPVSAKELSAALGASPPATKSLQRDIAMESVDPVKDLGSRLFDALFQGSLWRLYEGMRSRDEAIRIRIVAEGDAAQLPWELLYDRHREDFLVLSTRSPLVRQAGSATAVSQPRPTPPVRMLVVVVDIAGQIQSDEEIRRIQALDRAGVLEMMVLSGSEATFNGFTTRLANDHVDIIHFIGNGVETGPTSPTRFGGSRQSLVFMPPHEQSRTKDVSSAGYDTISERRLAAALARQSGLRLVVLNACSTDVLAAGLGDLAPAVIGIRGVVTESAALAFSEGLYGSLLEGNPLETAVTAGRLAIDSSEPGGREWSAPVFYMRSATGDFLDGPGATPTVSVRGSVSSSGDGIAVGSRDSLVAQSLINIFDTNLAVLNAQVEQSNAASPTYVAEQVEAATKEVDRLHTELANLPPVSEAER
jgi:CHAT domain